MCQTPTFQGIHNLLISCQRFGLLGAVEGDSGTSKTAAVKEFARPQGKPARRAVYFEVRKAAATMRHFLVQLHDALGRHTARESGNHEIYARLVEELHQMKQRDGL